MKSPRDSQENGRPSVKVAFICLGNICRSPLAWAIFQAYLSAHHPEISPSMIAVDSAGTASHTQGRPVDQRSLRVAKKYEKELPGVASLLTKHTAKLVTTAILASFDYILVMDHSNEADIRHLFKRLKLAEDHKKEINDRVFLFGNFSQRKHTGDDIVIEDPWYGEEQDFDLAYKQCVASTAGFIAFLKEKFDI